jgi:outer membrane protein TolC
MNRRTATASFLCLLFLQALSWATDPFSEYVDWRYRPPKMQIKNIEGLEQRIRDGKLHLRLQEFLELALKNSTDIQLTKLDVYTAANDITANKAPFDPLLTLGFNTLRSVSPLSFVSFGGSGSTGIIAGSTGSSGSGQTGGTGTGATSTGGQVILPQTISSLSQNSTANYTELLPTGQTVQANFSVFRSSGDGYLYPALFGALNVTLTQHLLQNRTNLQAKGPLQIARTQLLITSERSQATIADSIATAARQYWSAIEMRDTVGVQEQNVELARKSYEHDKQALDLGALARLDIYQSETQVAERNRDLIAAKFQYKSALDAMRRVIGADLTPALRDTEIVLEDNAASLPPKSSILPFEKALAKAVQSRPENLAARQQFAIDKVNERIARDQLLPLFDLSMQGGGTGPGFNQASNSNGGTGNVPNPYPGLGPTLGQVLAFNYPSYGFGLTLNFPFRNSSARASLSNAVVSRVRDQYTQRQTEQQITFDVRQALNSLELADASIDAATRARDLARKNVDAEQQKYQLGTITAFEVLDSQTRLASSESALLAAYVGYQQAFIDYQRATWTLLDGLGMVVESPSNQ